jgi:hypothetical protein
MVLALIAYSIESLPPTFASFLCCNKQIFEEMNEAIRVVRREASMAAKLDCIAENESFHSFTWRSIPFVKTTLSPSEGGERGLTGWMGKLLRLPPRGLLHSGYLTSRTYSTMLPRLWIDIRLVEDRADTWFRIRNSPDRTAWAICAALRRLFQYGPNFSATTETVHTITVDELVLNVVPPLASPKHESPENAAAPESSTELDRAQRVAKEVLHVWNKIWRGDDFSGAYQILLERITCVEIRVDGQVWRSRQLRLELERGQAERRRIAARGGW